MGLPRFRVSERQVLLWMLGGLMVAYAATFLVTAYRKHGEPLKLASEPRVRRMHGSFRENTNDQRYIVAQLFDPSVMSLPTPDGFSADLWLNGPNASQRATDWQTGPAFQPTPAPSEPPVLLPAPSLPEVVAATAEKAMPVAVGPALPPVVGPGSAEHSMFVMFGVLQDRQVLAEPSLPVVTNEAPLRPTWLRVAVTGGGAVRYAAVERTCGNEQADATAVRAAQGLYFAPADLRALDALTWDVIGVEWITVQPPVTNTVAVPIP